MDNFYEQLNKTDKSPVYIFVSILSYAFFLIALINIFSFNILISAVTLVLGLALFFFKRKLLVEYEYDYTNGEIDIDKIIEQKKRKRIITFNVKEIESYGKESMDSISKYRNMGKVINAVASNNENKVYGLYVISESQRYYIRMTLDEKLYELINRLNKRAEIR